MAALTVGVLAVSHQAMAQENNDTTPVPLFGNEGLGTGSLSLAGTVPAASGYSHPTLAQGFKVGETSYILTSVDLGLVLSTSAANAFNNPDSGNAIDIALFSSVTDELSGLEVPNERVATFSSIPTNGPFVANRKLLYSFDYLLPENGELFTLEADQTYWLIVSYKDLRSGAALFYWSYAAPSGTDLPENETPVDKTIPPGTEGVGFEYVGTMGQHNFGDAWINHGKNNTQFSDSGLRFTVNGYEAPVIIDGGGGGGIDQTPPTLDCYALSKGFFKNNYPAGWPAAVIANGGALIGTQVYTIDQLRTMLGTNSTRGNQIGQLSSQLVAVHLSRLLAIQTAGAQYADWWLGWAPDSAEAQAAYDQAATLINASAGFETYRGKLRLTGCVTGVSPLINSLNDYIYDNHCEDAENGDDDDDECRRERRGCNKKDRDRTRCSKKVKYERRDHRKSHTCN